MPQTYPFLAFGASASTIGIADTAVATVTLNVGTAALSATSIRVANAGSVAAWIQFVSAGGTTTVQISQGIYLASATVNTFRLGGQSKMQMITSVGTASLFVTVGEGMPTT